MRTSTRRLPAIFQTALIPVIAICTFHGLTTQITQAAETFGNFETLGVVLDAPAGVSPEQIKEVRLFEVQGTKLRRLLDPVQVHTYSYYVGSAFGLKPNTAYNFQADYIGKNGQQIHREQFQGRTRPEPTKPPAAVREIHVAKSGSDTNPGTMAQPKLTVAAALKNANRAGTHVIIHQGTYFEGGLPSVTRGTAQAPVVIRAAKGETVRFDGSAIRSLNAKWKDLGSGYFSTPYTGKSWLVAIHNGKTGVTRRMYPVGSLANLKARKVGGHSFKTYKVEEAYYCSGKEITVYCPYYRPSEMRIHIAHQQGVVEHSNAQHVTYSDITCQFYQGQVFYVNSSNDITFRRCRFLYCTLPIAVKRASNRLLVEHCQFIDDCTRWGFLPKGMDDVGYSAQIELGGVYVHNPYEGRGMVVRNNVFDGLFDAINLTPMGPPPKVRSHETDFYDNRVIKVCDDLIEADGQCRNLRIFRNRMSNFLSGVSIAQGYHGPTYVMHNVLSGAGNTSATRLPPHYEGYPIKTNGGTKYGSTGWAFFFHNTSHTSIPNTNAFRTQSAEWRKLVFANNIWQGTRDGFVFWRDNVSPIEMTRDLIHAETGALLKVRSKTYATPQSAGRQFSFMKDVLVGDPKFMDPSSGDFRLREGSPAIDAGKIIPGVNDTVYNGARPDIGAFERTN